MIRYTCQTSNGAGRVTQNVQAKHAFPGDVPANLRCGFCGELVQGVFYRARNRFVCASCAEQVNQLIERNTISPAWAASAVKNASLTYDA